ncbi:hypothetical protein PanWU01x14_069830 [Parasponia andersonii]|uniref:Uncharacterized protein n=1 Tax=Parasponia andersonii TaxID=3476 RepID=A0A2P5DEP6_PARAD|nr:hypothetical protein PanWU01x14_069830 [Parasponia andersonii]
MNWSSLTRVLTYEDPSRYYEGICRVQRSFLKENPRYVGTKKWLPPPKGWIQLNTDVQMREEDATVVVAILIAYIEVVPFNKPIIVEVVAVRKALCLAKEQRFLDVVIKGDSAQALSTIFGKCLVSSWEVDTIVRDCRNLI